MTIHTPEWVRDAVFYQVFPDRFAISERVAKPGPLEPWDAPPTNHGFKGGDLLGVVEHLPYLAGPGRQRALPHADLPVGLEPPLPHVRLPDGRPAARRRRRAARAAGRGARARHAGRARRRVQPHGPRLLGVPPRARERRRVARTATGSTAIRPRSTGRDRCARTRSRPTSTRRPTSRRSSRPTIPTATNRCAASATGRGGGCRRCPSSTPSNPEVREHLLSRRRALAPVRDRRLAPRRPDRDQGRGVLAGVPAPLPRDQPRRLHRRRDLARGAGVARRRPVRRGDELPARRGDPRLRRAGPPQRARRARPPRVRRHGPPPRRRRVRPGAGAPDGPLRPGRDGCPAQPARLPRQPAVPDDGLRRPGLVPPRGPAPGDAAGRAVHLLRRRGRRDRRQRPGVPARHAVGRDRVGPRRARLDAGGVRRPPRAAEPSPGHVPRRGRDGRCARVRA